MATQSNNSINVFGTLETSFLDGPKSPLTHTGEVHFVNNATTSSTSNNITIGDKGTSLIEISPVAIRASDNQLTNKEKSINPVTIVNACSYVILVVVIILVIGLMLIPLILYFTSLPSEDATLSRFNLLDYKNCLVSCYSCYTVV